MEYLTILPSIITELLLPEDEYFLLLNNDTEIINPNCLGELLGTACEVM